MSLKKWIVGTVATATLSVGVAAGWVLYRSNQYVKNTKTENASSSSIVNSFHEAWRAITNIVDGKSSGEILAQKYRVTANAKLIPLNPILPDGWKPTVAEALARESMAWDEIMEQGPTLSVRAHNAYNALEDGTLPNSKGTVAVWWDNLVGPSRNDGTGKTDSNPALNHQ